ncbi:MAG: asparaginase [Phycisphaeraceae bacterium]|nr:MAG: asparaginase [Phycisphaeraceae bacterium]
MSSNLPRRSFLAAAGASALAFAGAPRVFARNQQRAGGGAGRRPVSIASGNGVPATTKAVELIRDGADPLDAVVAGVRILEDDPNDMTVGLGGLPNEEGIVELDASVMHGPTHRAGAVASLRNIRYPSAVAREVARRTDHVLLVSDGALRFAKRMGFQEENLLTEEARRAWLRWKAGLNRDDNWLEPDQFDLPMTPDNRRGAADAAIDDRILTGTIHCSAVTAGGDLAGTTTTSGLPWKLPGRVGDSPIIGAGLYTDNAIGSAGATGRGEAVIQVCGANAAVARMGAGDHPTDACIAVLKMISERTRARRLQDDKGRPRFNVVMYAVRKDGVYGSACMHEGRQFAISDERGDRLEDCAFLYARD